MKLDDAQQILLLNAVMAQRVEARKRADRCLDPAQEEYWRHEFDAHQELWLLLCQADQITLTGFPVLA